LDELSAAFVTANPTEIEIRELNRRLKEFSKFVIPISIKSQIYSIIERINKANTLTDENARNELLKQAKFDLWLLDY